MTGGYFDESSVANEYIQGQTQMFLRNGLIIACGDWFSTEMRELAADYAAETLPASISGDSFLSFCTFLAAIYNLSHVPSY